MIFSPESCASFGMSIFQLIIPVLSFETVTVLMSGPCGSSPRESWKVTEFAVARAGVAPPPTGNTTARAANRLRSGRVRTKE